MLKVKTRASENVNLAQRLEQFCVVVVQSVQVLADSNENNLDEMIQSFNAYIDTYNSTNSEQFDGK